MSLVNLEAIRAEVARRRAVELAISAEQEAKNFQNRERPEPKGKGKGKKGSSKKSPRAASWDESKHPRAEAGQPEGGQFVPVGEARDERGARAQKDSQAAENYRKVQQEKDPRGAISKLNDKDLNALSEYLYSFKSNDKKIVSRRAAVALELRKRGRDVNDHGGRGKGRPAGRGSGKAARRSARRA